MTYASDIRPPIVLAVIGDVATEVKGALVSALRAEPDVFEIKHNPVDEAMAIVAERRANGYKAQFPTHVSELNLSDVLIALKDGAARHSEYAFLSYDPVLPYSDVNLYQNGDADLRRIFLDLLHCQDFFSAVSLFGAVADEARDSKMWFTTNIPSMGCARKLGDEVLLISQSQEELDGAPEGVYTYLLTPERAADPEAVLSDVAELLSKLAHGQ